SRRLPRSCSVDHPQNRGHQGMTPAHLLITFFLFTLGAVGACGYVFVLRPSRLEAADAEIPAPRAYDQPEMPLAQAAIVDMFRMIGEAIPGATVKADEARQKLIAAGYRWPSAVSIFVGIKAATAVMLAAVGAWAALTFGDGGVTLPVIC